MTSTAPHVYIDCDLPDGMTLAEWRRSRSARKPRGLRTTVRRLARLASP